MNTRLKQWDFYACIGISLAAFAYIFYRIFNIGFTMDEWGMWKDSIRPGLEALITFKQQIPQSHFFEGLFAMPFLKLLPLPPAESTRLASLVMLPVYAYAGLELTKHFKSSLFRLLFFSAWICPSAILEYFGLARGYAFMFAGCALSMVGLIEAYNLENSSLQKAKWTKISILSAAVALLSVLTFSYTYILIAFLLLARYFLESEYKSTWGKLKSTFYYGSFVVWTSIVLFVFYLPRYLILRHSDSMQWGGKSNFLSDTFTSCLDCLAGIPQDCNNIMNFGHVDQRIMVIVFGICLLNFGLYAFHFYLKKKPFNDFIHSPLVVSSLVFFGMAAMMQLLFWFFGMQLPTRRTVLYFWPIMVMMSGFAVVEYKPVFMKVLNICALLFAVGFSCTQYNMNSIIEYTIDCENDKIANTLFELSKYHTPERPMIVGVTDCMRYTIWYHLEYDNDLKPNPNLENNPIIKMFGDRVILYSLSYGYPQPFPNTWHHFPFSPDYYVLSPYEPGQKPNPDLMEMKPLYTFDICKTSIYKALPAPREKLGCKVENCMVCQMLYSMTGESTK